MVVDCEGQMGILILAVTLAALSGFGPVAAHADPDVTSAVDGAEVSWNGGAGTGSYDFFGLSGSLFVGSLLDPHNLTGDFHFSYTANFLPEDSSVQNGPRHRITDWEGGLSVNAWPKATLGLDYDSSSDPFDQLDSAGVRVSIGEGIFSLSNRFARTTLNTPITQGGHTTFQGAFIYQDTLQGGIRITLDRKDNVSLSGSYSFFHPEVADFATLLEQNQFAALSNLRSDLDNFELWNAGLVYRRKWNDRWDSKASFQFSHLLIAENPAIVAGLSGGYRWNPTLSARLGVRYFYLPSNPLTSVVSEISWSWERED